MNIQLNSQLIINALVIIALVGWIGIRQLSWRPVELARMWRTPLIMAIVGVVIVGNTFGKQGAVVLSGLDVSLLIIEIVISLGVGAAMGAIAQFRPMSSAARQAAADRSRDRQSAGRDSRSRGARLNGGGAATTPRVESRTGWWGFVLWVLFIAVRVGMDVWAGQMGSALASSTGVILILIAANRAARTAVFAGRIGRVLPASSVRPDAAAWPAAAQSAPSAPSAPPTQSAPSAQWAHSPQSAQSAQWAQSAQSAQPAQTAAAALAQSVAAQSVAAQAAAAHRAE